LVQKTGLLISPDPPEATKVRTFSRIRAA